MTVDQFPDRTVEVDGKSFLYFGGTSYLGMATHPEFQKLLCESIQQWGTAYGSSRNSNIQLSIYQEAETLFSSLIGCESALFVSSGTLAGKLVLDYLSQDATEFFHYHKTHPAILKDGSQALFVEGKVHPKLRDSKKSSVVISVDAVMSMAVEPTDFNFLDEISSSKKVILLIDESHSLGITGSEGEGIFHTISHACISQKIMVSSLTKAYGCSGGVIAGDEKLIKNIKKNAVFISAAGMNPIFLQTLVNAREILKEQLTKLRQNLEFFHTEGVLSPLFQYTKNYPVIYCHSNDIFEYLKSKAIIITNFKYPNYDFMMNRIVITANHTEADLKKLNEALIEFQKETLH